MEKPKIVACLIVKNEEEMLPRCLDSLKGADNFYICDTGSEDNTIEVAKKYTENVFTDYKWNDNFAEARNHVLSKVKEENAWIISIDADEKLENFEEVVKGVEDAIKANSKAVDCKLVSEGDNQFLNFPRIFKKDPTVFWEGEWHNFVNVPHGNPSKVVIYFGHSPAHQKDPERALRIGEKAAKSNPSARNLYYLGRQYTYLARFKDAVEVLNKSVEKEHFHAQKADAYLLIARSYWAMGKGDEAREACMKAIIINPNFKEAINFMVVLSGRGTGNPLWEKNSFQWERMATTADNSGVLFVRN